MRRFWTWWVRKSYNSELSKNTVREKNYIRCTIISITVQIFLQHSNCEIKNGNNTVWLRYIMLYPGDAGFSCCLCRWMRVKLLLYVIFSSRSTISQFYLKLFLKCFSVSIANIYKMRINNRVSVKQTRDIHPSLAQCWPTVYDASTTLAQHSTKLGWTHHVCWVITM